MLSGLCVFAVRTLARQCHHLAWSWVRRSRKGVTEAVGVDRMAVSRDSLIAWFDKATRPGDSCSWTAGVDEQAG